MDGWGVSTFRWGVYSVLPDIVTFVITRVWGFTKGPDNLFFKPGTRVRFCDNSFVSMTTPTLLRV